MSALGRHNGLCYIVLKHHMLLSAAQVGARGKDEWGAMFASSMKRSSVGISKMRVQPGQTGHKLLLARPALLKPFTAHYVHAAFTHEVRSCMNYRTASVSVPLPDP